MTFEQRIQQALGTIYFQLLATQQQFEDLQAKQSPPEKEKES